ncbi:MAG: hypothetical protein Q4P33_05855 [Flaviflexus sp.]|nr:hypothetical protein [Flaviflexus sp.]
MSDNGDNDRYGLTKSMKAMLIVIGILLAILVFLVWTFIIQTSQAAVSGPDRPQPTEVKTLSPDDIEPPEAKETEDASLKQAHDKVAAMAANPGCADVAADAATMSEFLERREAGAGVDETSTQLVIDALQRINSTCDRDYVGTLKDQLASPSTAPALTAIAVENEWVTPARPPGKGSIPVSDFTTNNKNIHCALETERVACTVFDYSYPPTPPSCASFPQTFVTRETGATERNCDFRIQSGRDVGNGFFHNDTFACQVRSEARLVECWSQLTGHGFRTHAGESGVF